MKRVRLFVALVFAARLVLDQIDGDPLSAQLGRQVFLAVIYWLVFNLLFRAWLRPNRFPLGIA